MRLDGRRGGERKLKVIRVRGDKTMDEVDLLERVMDILGQNLSARNREKVRPGRNGYFIINCIRKIVIGSWTVDIDAPKCPLIQQ